jgi:hypothetical protein
MKGIEGQENNIQLNPIHFEQIKTTNNLLSDINNINNNKSHPKLKISKTKKKVTNIEENQEKIKRSLLNEFGIQEKTDIKTFKCSDLI